MDSSLARRRWDCAPASEGRRPARRPRASWRSRAWGLFLLPSCWVAVWPAAWSGAPWQAAAGRPQRRPFPGPRLWPKALLPPPPRTARSATRGEEAARFAAEAQNLRRPKRKVEREDIDLRFSRSSGPGGQNVNKVETKVDARFDVHTASFLPEWVKKNLLEQQANRVNRQGMLAFSVQEQRTQQDNIRLAIRKLQGWIDEASYIPPPPDKEKEARIRRVRKAASQKRVEDKRKKSLRRKLRMQGY